jgi:hypothetical protein
MNVVITVTIQWGNIMTVVMVMLLKEALICLRCFFGNNEFKQKTVYSFMTYFVHVLLYNAAKYVYMLTLRIFRN